jgi:hypothetical protein
MQAVKLWEMFNAIGANARTFEAIEYDDPKQALSDLRNSRINAVLSIPPDFSRRSRTNCAADRAAEDNTDNFVAATLEGLFTQLVSEYGQKPDSTRMTTGHALRGGDLPLCLTSNTCSQAPSRFQSL